MEQQPKQSEIQCECYNNGELQLLPISEAINELCKADYGIVAKADRAIWNVAGHKGWNRMFKIAGEKATQLGLYTHLLGGQPFSVDDAEIQINGRKELTQEYFYSLAARFNKIYRYKVHGDPLPRTEWPFRHLKIMNGTARPAYQMRDDRNSFVVMCTDQDQDVSLPIQFWASFWKEFEKKWLPD